VAKKGVVTTEENRKNVRGCLITIILKTIGTQKN
jgi:hypothetical protein